MFNKFFRQIGGIFATTETSDKKTTNVDSQDDIESTQNLGSPSAASLDANTEGIAVTEDVVDPSMFKPTKRYGRICECPKDPEFSMFCSKARNWYEMTSTGSLSLEFDTEAKYARLK